ncbi:MAG: VacJ family lipoprotein [Deltaproteobacteria bacterium]|nr:VacJ family lipoprotein [Deltaproteobacteria bacterium]
MLFPKFSLGARRALSLLLLCCLAGSLGCASTHGDKPLQDPYEGMNRKIFSFNEGVDKWVLDPVATGWGWVMPAPVQGSVKRFFVNLRYPVRLGNNLLQGKPTAAGIDTGRFLVNTTVGILGFFDPAGHWGMEPQNADFGQTLALWRVPQGPYLVLPLVGAASGRHAPGLGVDTAMSVVPFVAPTEVSLGATTLNVINLRAIHDDDIDNARETAFDYYIFVRDAYEQRRRRVVWGKSVTTPSSDSEDEEDLYDDLYDDDLYDDPSEEPSAIDEEPSAAESTSNEE